MSKLAAVTVHITREIKTVIRQPKSVVKFMKEKKDDASANKWLAQSLK